MRRGPTHSLMTASVHSPSRVASSRVKAGSSNFAAGSASSCAMVYVGSGRSVEDFMCSRLPASLVVPRSLAMVKLL